MTNGWSAGSREAWLRGSLTSPDPVDVFKRLCEGFARYLEFPREQATGIGATLALWSLFTYVFRAWLSVPYLSIGGPLKSGKSTVFRILAQVVFRPLPSSNLTAPCLFRTLHEHGGTMLMDEAERPCERTPEAAELRSVLLAGYQADMPARRLEPCGNGYRSMEFDVYGPKAFAAISRLPETLASRSIRIRMFRAGPESEKPRYRIEDYSEFWRSLRNDLHVLALEHGNVWAELARRSNVAPSELAARDYELWQPLLALAGWIEEHGAPDLLEFTQDFAIAHTEQERESTLPDADEMLLRILAEHVIAGTQGTLKAGDVLKLAKSQDLETFRRWSAKGVAEVFKRYGLCTHKRHGRTGKTYQRVNLRQLRQIESTYGFDLGLPNEDVPQVPQVESANAQT